MGLIPVIKETSRTSVVKFYGCYKSYFESVVIQQQNNIVIKTLMHVRDFKLILGNKRKYAFNGQE
jgi:hypothetical protein